MRKIVENVDVEELAKNTADLDGERLCTSCDRVTLVRRGLVRWSSFLTGARLRNAIKFLLFQEENPRQGCAGNFHPVWIAVYLIGLMLPCIVLLLLGWMYGGVLGFIIAYVIDCVLPLEILHCIFDR